MKKFHIQKKIDEWIYILRNNEIAEGSHSKNIDKAEQKLSELNMSEVERKTYEKFLINTVRDRYTIDTARAEGELKGKLEGKIEAKNEIAVELLKNGVPVIIISKSTNLTIEEIEKIKLELSLNTKISH